LRDWIVKLIGRISGKATRRNGTRGLSADGVERSIRGRYAEGFEKPKAIEAEQGPWNTRGACYTQNYTFKTGHRIMVQVQSTWFPIIDRNPQTFVPNIFQAGGWENDFKAATHRVYRTPQYPSRVDVPVVRAR
jgi:predicted acyl esterase